MESFSACNILIFRPSYSFSRPHFICPVSTYLECPLTGILKVRDWRWLFTWSQRRSTHDERWPPVVDDGWLKVSQLSELAQVKTCRKHEHSANSVSRYVNDGESSRLFTCPNVRWNWRRIIWSSRCVIKLSKWVHNDSCVASAGRDEGLVNRLQDGRNT